MKLLMWFFLLTSSAWAIRGESFAFPPRSPYYGNCTLYSTTATQEYFGDSFVGMASVLCEDIACNFSGVMFYGDGRDECQVRGYALPAPGSCQPCYHLTIYCDDIAPYVFPTMVPAGCVP